LSVLRELAADLIGIMLVRNGLGAIVADCPGSVARINQKNDGQQREGMLPGALQPEFRILRETRMSLRVHRLAGSGVMRWTHMHAYRMKRALRYNPALRATGRQLSPASDSVTNAKLLASGSNSPLNDY
jgi:hypothetical protein